MAIPLPQVQVEKEVAGEPSPDKKHRVTEDLLPEQIVGAYTPRRCTFFHPKMRSCLG